MTTIAYLLNVANVFLIERDWWQFHNPKNDAVNIIVEAGELAEWFIKDEDILPATRAEVANELADVLFATLSFSLATKTNIAQAMGNVINNVNLKDADTPYEQLQELALEHLDTFELNNVTTPRQIVLSLINQASQLLDLYVWLSTEQSIARTQEKQAHVMNHVARIVAHVMLFASLTDIDLIQAYKHKMEKNREKYPSNISSAQGYIKIKDHARGRDK